MNESIYKTLFLLQSVDGKISSGAGVYYDFDKDLPKLTGDVSLGLEQYYQAEQKTDLLSVNSGKTLSKIGVNSKPWSEVEKCDVTYAVIDNKPWLNENGVRGLAKRADFLYIFTENKKHPAWRLVKEIDNMKVVLSSEWSTFMWRVLSDDGWEKATIQTGASLNALWLKLGLIQEISLLVAPCIIGSKHAPGIVEGLQEQPSLNHISSLKLISAEVLDHSYLHLRYNVNGLPK